MKDVHEEEKKSSEEFVRTIEELKGAEKKAAEIVQEAQRNAAQIEKEAREKAVEISLHSNEDAVKLKNELIARGRKETEKEVEKIIAEAERKARKIRAARLPAAKVKKIAKEII